MYSEPTDSVGGMGPGQLANTIRELYNNDIPLFTKSTIINLMRQIGQIRSMIHKDEPTSDQTLFLE